MQEKENGKVFLGSAKEYNNGEFVGEHTTAYVVAENILEERRDSFAFKIGGNALIFQKEPNGDVFAEIRPIRKENLKGGENVEE